MKHFVSELAKVNRGRAFFASPTSLGQHILLDYVTNHGTKAAWHWGFCDAEQPKRASIHHCR